MQKFKLNLQTIKNGFAVIRILKIRYASCGGCEHSFVIFVSYRSRRYAWIVPQRKAHGEPSSYVKSPIWIQGSGSIFSACCGCNATVEKRLRITGWDYIHSNDHQKWNRFSKKLDVRIQIWIFQRTKNGHLTIIRTVRVRYTTWNGSEHRFGILGSYWSRMHVWIMAQRKTNGEPVRNVHILFPHSGGGRLSEMPGVVGYMP